MPNRDVTITVTPAQGAESHVVAIRNNQGSAGGFTLGAAGGPQVVSLPDNTKYWISAFTVIGGVTSMEPAECTLVLGNPPGEGVPSPVSVSAGASSGNGAGGPE